jgi:hypothetical protein
MVSRRALIVCGGLGASAAGLGNASLSMPFQKFSHVSGCRLLTLRARLRRRIHASAVLAPKGDAGVTNYAHVQNTLVQD